MLRRIHSVSLSVIFLFSIGTTCCVAADELVVTFQMSSPDLPENTPVYITGSVPELGNWRPGQVQMEHLGDHVWSIRIRIKDQQTIEYKYTPGSWAREGAGADGRPLKNLTVSVDKSMSKQDRILSWTDRRPREVRGQITGVVKYHRGLKDVDLRPRDVVVWLPPGYDSFDDQRYSNPCVVRLIDGHATSLPCYDEENH